MSGAIAASEWEWDDEHEGPGRAARTGARRHGAFGASALIIALAIGLVIGTGVSAAMQSLVEEWRVAEVAAVVASHPEPQPLPREWRWSPPTVKVDHMFRQRR